MQTVSPKPANQLWSTEDPQTQVTDLLTDVFARVARYYERIETTPVDRGLINRAAKRAWRRIDRDNELAITKDYFGYAAYAMTLNYPDSRAIKNFARVGVIDLSYTAVFEMLPRYFDIPDDVAKRAITWQLKQFDELLQDIQISPKEKHQSILRSILQAQFAPLVYMLHALPKEEVQENYLRYQRLSFYFGLSYVIDSITDDPSVSPAIKDKVDNAITTILRGGSLDDEPEDKIVQLAVKYLQRFSDEIRGSQEEEALRVHLLAFQRVQRAAQGTGDQPGIPSDANHLSTAKSAFSYYVVSLLFNRVHVPDYWDRLFPVATVAQMSDDIKDYEGDLQAKQLTPLTVYANGAELSDPLALWPKIMTDCLEDTARGLQRSVMLMTIKKIAMQPSQILRDHWPQPLTDSADSLLRKMYPRIRRYSCVAPNLDPKRLTHNGPGRALVKNMYGDFVQHRQEVTKALIDLCEAGETQLHSDMAHALEGGKCGRSYLIRLIAEHYGESPLHMLPFMLAVEMAQTSSLVFDDLPSQDNADKRRGKPCLHTERPVYEAELAGISLLTEPFRLMCSWNIAPELRVRIMELSARAIGPTGLCLGQLIDLDESPETFEDFIKMYDLKTSNGFLIPLVGAAIASKASEDDIEKLKVLAHKLGVAYQIRDDMLEDVFDDKTAERTALRILDVDAERAKDLFFSYRRDIFDSVFELFNGEVRVKFLRLFMKLLMLPNEDSPYQQG